MIIMHWRLAMYKTGVINSYNDFFDTIKSITEEVGFKGERLSDTQLIINKDEAFFYFELGNLRNNNVTHTGNGIRLYLSVNSIKYTSRPSGTVFSDNYFFPIVKYHAFYNETQFYFVMETSAGIFTHILFAKINNIWFISQRGSVNYYSHYIYDIFGPNALLLVDGETISLHQHVYRPSNDFLSIRSLLDKTPSTSTGATPLFPFLVFSKKNNVSITFHGQAPNIRALNIHNYLPAESLFLGNDEWMVFPCISKTFRWGDSGTNYQNSNLYGVAYKKQ